MPTTLASTTDGPEGIRATMEAFGLEPDTPETAEAQPADPNASPAPPVAPDGKTAAGTDPATETQENPEGAEGTEPAAAAAEPARGQDGKFKPGDLPRSVQKKIDKSVKAQREAERERDEARQRADALDTRLAQLEQRLEGLNTPTAATPADTTVKTEAKPGQKAPTRPEPKLEDFASAEDPYAAYTKDLIAWNREQWNADLDDKLAATASKAKTEAKQEVASDTEAAQRVAEYHERVAAASEMLPDYEEVTKAATAADLQISAALNDAIAHYAPDGTDVLFLYYLAKNPELCQKLTDASVYDPKKASPKEVVAKNRFVIRELAKLEPEIEALIPAEPAAEPKPAGKGKTLADAASEGPSTPANPQQASKASRAPAPITPVRGGSAAAAPDPSNMTGSQYTEFLRSAAGKSWYLSQGGTERDWLVLSRAR